MSIIGLIINLFNNTNALWLCQVKMKAMDNNVSDNISIIRNENIIELCECECDDEECDPFDKLITLFKQNGVKFTPDPFCLTVAFPTEDEAIKAELLVECY